MKKKKKLIIVLVIVIGIAIAIGLNVSNQRSKGVQVESEKIYKRDLTSLVSASGQVKAKKTVNISANSLGTITKLGVQEGDYVKQDQFLLLIDPVPLQKTVDRLRASLKTAEAAVEIAKTNSNKASADTRRIEELYQKNLTSRAEYDNAIAVLEIAKKQLQSAKLGIEQEKAALQSADHDLKKVTVLSPIEGIVTRLNVEEGENVIMGTMNNAGTVIMVISDMSIVEVELEVDETDVVDVRLRQKAKITLDAYPDKSFAAEVTEIGNSPILATTATLTSTTAVNFKVVVTLVEKVTGVRPGFSATAEITTNYKKNVVGVPIQALVTREVLLDKEGKLVPNADKVKQKDSNTMKYQKKEKEGVFLVAGGKAKFAPITTGIAGESYFEVRTGLKENDVVITGPYKMLREIKDGDRIKIKEPQK